MKLKQINPDFDCFDNSSFDDYNFCNVKFSAGLLLTLSVPS